MLHSQTIKCWIFCIPQDHWSCQSLLYIRVYSTVRCRVYRVACEDLFILGQNITLHCHSQPDLMCQDDSQANYNYLDTDEISIYTWLQCILACDVSLHLHTDWLYLLTNLSIQSPVGTNSLPGYNIMSCVIHIFLNRRNRQSWLCLVEMKY